MMDPTIRMFANDVIIIGSVRADWLAPCNATIGNPRADKLGRNGFECIVLRCSVDRERCVLTTCMHSAIESYSMLHLQRWLACRGIKRSGTKSLFMIMSHNCQSCVRVSVVCLDVLCAVIFRLGASCFLPVVFARCASPSQ